MKPRNRNVPVFAEGSHLTFRWGEKREKKKDAGGGGGGGVFFWGFFCGGGGGSQANRERGKAGKGADQGSGKEEILGLETVQTKKRNSE